MIVSNYSSRSTMGINPYQQANRINKLYESQKGLSEEIEDRMTHIVDFSDDGLKESYYDIIKSSGSKSRDLKKYVESYNEIKDQIESGGKDSKERLELLDQAFDELIEVEARASSKEVKQFFDSYGGDEDSPIDKKDYRNTFIEIAKALQSLGEGYTDKEASKKIDGLLDLDGVGSYEEFNLVKGISAFSAQLNKGIHSIASRIMSADESYFESQRAEVDKLHKEIDGFMDEFNEFDQWTEALSNSTLSDGLKETFQKGIDGMAKDKLEVEGIANNFAKHLNNYLNFVDELSFLDTRYEKYDERLKEYKEDNNLELMASQMEKMSKLNIEIKETNQEKQQETIYMANDRSDMKVYKNNAEEWLED